MKKIIKDFGAMSLVRSGECEVYSITENKQKLFLKIKRANSCTNFEVEALTLRKLGALGVKVARVIEQSASSIIISGNLGKCLNDRPYLFLKRAIYEDLSKDLKNFYKIEFDGFGLIEDFIRARGRHKNWTDFFDNIGPWAENIKNHSLADKGSVEILEKYWQINSPLLKSVKRSYLVHGDFCLDHIFAFKGSYSGIIDFGDAFAGDPLMDLAYFKLKEITKPYGTKIFELLKESYEKFQSVGPEQMVLINLYMIYWSLRRVSESGDASISQAFAKKLERLATDLKTIA